MISLSSDTLYKVHQLFSDSASEQVIRLLEEECSDNLPGYKGISDPVRFERVRFAVLKLSEGDFQNFCHILNLAKRDWRNVLSGAGFGRDLQAHKQWNPK